MVEFTQATSEDVLGIYPQLPQSRPASLSYGREVFEKGLVPLEGRSIAIRECGRCIGAYGIIEMWPGVARAWALFSESVIKEHPSLLGFRVQKDLRRAEQLGFHRIEATTCVEHIEASVFLAWLGFAQEGLMRCYTPGRDHTYLYAKVKDVL